MARGGCSCHDTHRPRPRAANPLLSTPHLFSGVLFLLQWKEREGGFSHCCVPARSHTYVSWVLNTDPDDITAMNGAFWLYNLFGLERRPSDVWRVKEELFKGRIERVCPRKNARIRLEEVVRFNQGKLGSGQLRYFCFLVGHSLIFLSLVRMLSMTKTISKNVLHARVSRVQRLCTVF